MVVGVLLMQKKCVLIPIRHFFSLFLHPLPVEAKDDGRRQEEAFPL